MRIQNIGNPFLKLDRFSKVAPLVHSLVRACFFLAGHCLSPWGFAFPHGMLYLPWVGVSSMIERMRGRPHSRSFFFLSCPVCQNERHIAFTPTILEIKKNEANLDFEGQRIQRRAAVTDWFAAGGNVEGPRKKNATR